jgi:hypothetical protein
LEALQRAFPRVKTRLLLIFFFATIAFISRQRVVQSFNCTISPELYPSFMPVQRIKRLSCGNELLISDILWLRLIQTIGAQDTGTTQRRNECIWLIRTIVNLDPHFLPVYWFAAFTIGGEGRNPGEVDRILKIGIQANPKSWGLLFIAGANAYLFSHNNVQASIYYSLGAKLPGAPPWLARQSEILSSNIPGLIKDIHVWEAIYASKQDEHVRQIAKEHLCELWRTVYEKSPSEIIKRRAASKLKLLGVQARP